MRTTLMGLAVTVAMAVGCSGGESVSRSPLTTEADTGTGGGAGSVAAPICGQGETRACLGPGACEGAQMCSADALWGPCECADEPATGGGGGAVAATGGASGEGGEAVVAGCDPGWLYCANLCVNPLADVTNCGACGAGCDPVSEVCAAGECECAPGLTDCSAVGDAYRCADLLTDPNHCGTCTGYCGGNSCVAGNCVH